MIAGTSLALVATSDEKVPTVDFSTSYSGARVSLTADAPSAQFVVQIRAYALGPHNTNSALNARASVSGRVSASDDLSASRPFVQVSGQGGDTLSVLTEFNTSQALTFTGDCAQPNTRTPCEATFLLSLSRSDGGQRGGTVFIDWDVDFESSAPSNQAAQAASPWLIQVAPLS